LEKVKDVLGNAVLMHLKGLLEDELPLTEPSASADYLTVA